MFVLIKVKAHHLLLQSCHPLFHNFRQFNMNATPAHHSVIQNELDELLTKGTFEPSIGGTGS